MNSYIGKKVLVTTSNWFYGKDGLSYRAIYGTLKAIKEAKEVVGFIPNRSHANWFYEIGNMIIMGCQVMYIEQVDIVNDSRVLEWQSGTNDGKNSIEYERPTAIYIVD